MGKRSRDEAARAAAAPTAASNKTTVHMNVNMNGDVNKDGNGVGDEMEHKSKRRRRDDGGKDDAGAARAQIADGAVDGQINGRSVVVDEEKRDELHREERRKEKRERKDKKERKSKAMLSGGAAVVNGDSEGLVVNEDGAGTHAETKEEKRKRKQSKKRKVKGDEALETERPVDAEVKTAAAAPAEEEETTMQTSLGEDKEITQPSQANDPAKAKKKQKSKSKSKTKPREQDAPQPDSSTNTTTPNTKAARFILFIGNLPYTTTTPALTTHFASLDPTHYTLRHITDLHTGKSKGYAFLEFDNYDRMRTCLKLYHHSKVAGRRINVELTAGGGGGSEKRRERLKERKERLEGQRKRWFEKEKEDKAARDGGIGERGKSEKGKSNGGGGGIVKPETETQVQGEGTMHPSRAAMIDKAQR